MLKSFVTTLAKKIRPIKNRIEDWIAEAKFDNKVSQASKNQNLDVNAMTFKFTYEGKEIKIKLPDVRDYISLNIISNNSFFDIHDLECTRKKIPVGGVVIDAGSNIGNHAIYYATICSASKVFCFEPQAEIFEILKENIELNNLSSSVIPFQLGLGETETTASIDFRDDTSISTRKKQVNHGGLYLKEDAGGGFKITTIDACLGNGLERLDFIKLDVQGFEDKVIRGALSVIKKFKPVVQVECMDKSLLNDNILPLMTSLNYRLTMVLDIDYIFESIEA